MRWRRRIGKSDPRVPPAAPLPLPVVIRSAAEARRAAQALLSLRPVLLWRPPRP